METFNFTALQPMTGAFWPYLVVIVIGFLPTEIWRTLGVLVGKGLDENSEIFHWVRMVAAALVTAVVAKLLVSANGALATLPLWGRLAAIVIGLTVMMLTKRSILLGLFAGEIAIIAIGAMT
jgi:Branched-chain amino acid transport protein (AzlD)